MTDGERALLDAFRRAVRAGIERDLEREAALAHDLREDVLPRLREALRAARERGAVGRAWLFGSFTDAPREASDVDVLVEGALHPLRLAAELGAAVGRDVHAIDIERAEPSLRERAVREGIEL